MKLFLLTLLAFSFVIGSSFFLVKDDPKHKVKTIVIDAGHGGKDPGCNGVNHNEKSVALAVALKLGKLIEEHLKDVKVIYTRKTDVFVDLEDRAKIANDNNADLFISIHCNAAGKPVMIKDKKTGKMRAKTYKNKKGKMVVVEITNPEPYGSETYVMGLKNEEGKMKVAQRENSAILLEDNYETKYQGFDPDSEESYIIMSNYTTGYVINSAGLALKIQDEYLKKAGRVDKGVHRQSIWVLWRTAMPSVLTEIGYLTNPQEEKFLGSEKGQDYMASCLFRAFRKYKDEQEGTKKSYTDELENQKPLPTEFYTTPKEDTTDVNKHLDKIDEPKDIEIKKDDKEKELADKKAKELAEQKIEKLKKDSIIAAENKIKMDEESRLKAEQDAKLKKYKQFIVMADMNLKNKNYSEALSFYKNAEGVNVNKEKYPEQKIQEVEKILAKVVEAKDPHKTDSIDKVIHISSTPNATGIIFRVQFAGLDKEVDAKQKFPTVTDVSFYKVGAIYKYTSGNYSQFDDAIKQQTKLRELGFKDCFVAAFKNGLRMDINEARKQLELKKN